MATLTDVTTRTLDIVYGILPNERPKEDTINGAFTAGTTTMPVTTDTMWKRDDIAEFQPDGEQVIAASDGTGGNVTVRRGQRGTTDATQTSGDTILKNPPHTIARTEDKIREVFRHDLWPHVWTWLQGSFTFTSGDHMYDLAAYIEEVVLVYQGNLNSDERFHPLPNSYWDVERQIDTTFATNSNLLRVKQVFDEDQTVYYLAKRRPDIADIANVSDEVIDLIPYAAAAKLLAHRSGQSKHDAARSRLDEEGGGFLRDYRALMAEFLRMRDALSLRLEKEVRQDPRFRLRNRRRW